MLSQAHALTSVSTRISAALSPVAVSQIRTVRSQLPEASQLPSRATATAATTPTWPVSVRRSEMSGTSAGSHWFTRRGQRQLSRSSAAWIPQSGSEVENRRLCRR